MGAWSTKVFDNDMTLDILAEYKILLGYGISPEEAYKKVYAYFAKDFIGHDDEDDFWLGIALFQWKNGILLEEVKENALRCINDEKYLERWRDSGEKTYQKRKETLDIFKDKLLHEVNPTKKKFPKVPARYTEKTDWKVGDLIAYKITEKPYEGGYNNDEANKVSLMEHKLFNKYFLLRVIKVRKYPVSQICPELDYASKALVMLYDWYGEEVPGPKLVKQLEFKLIFGSMEETFFDEQGNFMEEPIWYQYMISGVCLSKEPSDKKVCETIILENDPKFCSEKPLLWQEHPDSQNLCPSQFNYIIAETYTDFGYEMRFYNR